LIETTFKTVLVCGRTCCLVLALGMMYFVPSEQRSLRCDGPKLIEVMFPAYPYVWKFFVFSLSKIHVVK